MTDRFANLKKVPKQPARRLLALANARLSLPLDSPPAADVSTVLHELASKDAPGDMIRLLAAALPAREGIWWACLAGGDLVTGGAPVPPTLAAARAWVFKPGDDTRENARLALETVDPLDDTDLCARAVTMHDGKMGTGDLAGLDAPVGAMSTMVLGMVLKSLSAAPPETLLAHIDLLIERALDIARGGNGRLETATGEIGETTP